MDSDQQSDLQTTKSDGEKLHGARLIEQKVATLPGGPGVYRMMDAQSNVLYVGKAKNLKSRVRAYTKLIGHNNRIMRMIEATADMGYPHRNRNRRAAAGSQSD